MHRPKTSSTALMNACSAATVAGFGAPPLVRSACSDGTRSLTAALSSAVLFLYPSLTAELKATIKNRIFFFSLSFSRGSPQPRSLASV